MSYIKFINKQQKFLKFCYKVYKINFNFISFDITDIYSKIQMDEKWNMFCPQSFLSFVNKTFFPSRSIQDPPALWVINNSGCLTSATIIDNYGSFALASQSGNPSAIFTSAYTYLLTSDPSSLTTIDRLFSPTLRSRSTPVGDPEYFSFIDQLDHRSLVTSVETYSRKIISWIMPRKD